MIFDSLARLADMPRTMHVVGLDTVDEPFGAIETGEREQLAEYIDAVLTGAGVDVAALTARRGWHRGELTDSWRDW